MLITSTLDGTKAKGWKLSLTGYTGRMDPVADVPY